MWCHGCLWVALSGAERAGCEGKGRQGGGGEGRPRTAGRDRRSVGVPVTGAGDLDRKLKDAALLQIMFVLYMLLHSLSRSGPATAAAARPRSALPAGVARPRPLHPVRAHSHLHRRWSWLSLQLRRHRLLGFRCLIRPLAVARAHRPSIAGKSILLCLPGYTIHASSKDSDEKR